MLGHIAGIKKLPQVQKILSYIIRICGHTKLPRLQYFGPRVTERLSGLEHQPPGVTRSQKTTLIKYQS